MIRVVSYGKSMYGGWYVSYLEKRNNDYSGKHYRTLKELKDDMEKIMYILLITNNIDMIMYK